LRLESIKSLYDPSYIDPSWINTVINLIPTMKNIISTNCPGLKLAITEYNWGGIGDSNLLSGALAQVEVLAIFGREGVDLATRWTSPTSGSKIESAFNLFLNYDGKGSKVQGTSVQAISTNVDTVGAYAIDGGNGLLYVICINKITTITPVNVSLSTASTSSVTAYGFDASNNLKQLTNLNANWLSSTLLSFQLQPQSANLLVITLGQSTVTQTTSASGTGSSTVSSTGKTVTTSGSSSSGSKSGSVSSNSVSASKSGTSSVSSSGSNSVSASKSGSSSTTSTSYSNIISVILFLLFLVILI